MVGYKLSKNDWVTPFFVIFRSVREILLVTVFFEHPVRMDFTAQVRGIGDTFMQSDTISGGRAGKTSEIEVWRQFAVGPAAFLLLRVCISCYFCPGLQNISVSSAWHHIRGNYAAIITGCDRLASVITALIRCLRHTSNQAHNLLTSRLVIRESSRTF